MEAHRTGQDIIFQTYYSTPERTDGKDAEVAGFGIALDGLALGL